MMNISQDNHESSPKLIDDLWIKAVQKRKQEIESGKIIPIDGKEVFHKIKLKFNMK